MIGSYTWSGHRIVEEANGEIVATQRDTYEIMWRWSNLCEFVTSEVDRLSILFAANDQPTAEEFLPWM